MLKRGFKPHYCTLRGRIKGTGCSTLGHIVQWMYFYIVQLENIVKLFRCFMAYLALSGAPVERLTCSDGKKTHQKPVRTCPCAIDTKTMTHGAHTIVD